MMARTIALVLAAAMTASADYLYFSHDDGHIAVRDLISAKSSSSDMDDIFTGTGSIADLVIKMDTGLIYWTDESTRSIMRAKLDGSDVTTILDGDGHPYGLVIDSKKNMLYWTCHENDAVFRADIDTLSSSNKEQVASITQPHGLELDSDRQLIYIAGHDDGIIYTYSIADNQISELMTGMLEPRMLCVSSNGAKLYVTEGSGTVKYIYFDDVTNGATTIIDSIASPNGILVADDYVYVSDDQANFIYQVAESELPITATANSILIESTTPRAIALYSEDISPVESPSLEANEKLSSFVPSFRTVTFLIGVASIAVGSVIAVFRVGQAIQQQQKEQYTDIA